MYNWSPVTFDFLLNPFRTSNNISSFSKEPQISSAITPLNSFHAKERHGKERQLLASFFFDLSFCISTVLPLVIHVRVSPSRKALPHKVY